MSTHSQNLTRNDEQFLYLAACAGAAEIALGRLAVEQSGTEEIRQFGQHMVRDHGAVNQELKQLALSNGAQLPDALDEEHLKQMNQLQDLQGREFDRAYLDVMIMDHRKAIAEFEEETQQGGDQDLKQFAGRTLPKLQRHLEMAEDIAGRH